MTLLASPLESIESAVIWLLVVFSVATWGLALLKAAVRSSEGAGSAFS
jgi:biopolymer transport protein ExbB